jgi:hypothetical protein
MEPMEDRDYGYWDGTGTGPLENNDEDLLGSKTNVVGE